MKILIIGNLGYVGPLVTSRLAEASKNHSVYGYDIGFFASNVTIRNQYLPESQLKAQYFGDVRTFDASCLDGMDAVVYLAAISNDPMGKSFEHPTLDINQDCAISIAKMAREKGVKNFVFASSCSVYGLADSNPRNETSEVNPLTAYARSKVGGENGLRSLAAPGFNVVCLRFATACGFSPRLRLDLVLNDFVACALVNRKIEILSDGKPWRPLINVKDMARAIEWAIAFQPENNYLIVNAGSNEWNYQVIELAQAVGDQMPGVEISVNKNAQPDNRSYKVDFSLFKKLAGEYYPVIGLSETIDELVKGFTDLGFNDKNFRDSHLIRLKTLNQLIDTGKIDSDLRIIR